LEVVVVQDVVVLDVVRNRKLAHDFEYLEFQEWVFLKVKETRLSLEIHDNDFTFKEKDLTVLDKEKEWSRRRHETWSDLKETKGPPCT